jgi:hypothetical protein
MNKWTLTHENGSTIAVGPRNARELKLMRDCGYVTVDLNTGHGPHPIAEVIAAQEARENG